MVDIMNNRAVNMRNACINDDEDMFAEAVKGCDINLGIYCSGRRLGISGLHCIERTPLMLAIMYGSGRVLRHILTTPGVDVNRSSATDNLTALDCFFVYKPDPTFEYMLEACNAECKQPTDPGALHYSSNMNVITGEHDPDMCGWAYETEYFMMYKYKMRPCCLGDLCLGFRECPYLHPQDSSSRRDLREQTYSSTVCPYTRATCSRGSECGFAHGLYEWCFHPECFRTLACKNKMLCNQKGCCYAHNPLELRGRQEFAWVFPRPPPPPFPGPIFVPIPPKMPQFVEHYAPQVMNNLVVNHAGNGRGQIVQYYAPQVMNNSVVNPPVNGTPQYVQRQYNARLPLPYHAFGHGQVGAGPPQVMNNQSQNLKQELISRRARPSSSHNQGNPDGILDPSIQTGGDDIAKNLELSDQVPVGLDLSFAL